MAETCDELTLQKMHEAYTTSAKLEWLFWDSAFEQRQWLGLDNLK